MGGPAGRRGRRWLRRLGWTAGGLAVLGALLLGVLALASRPPAMAVPVRGATLDDVTIVNPGRGRLEHRTIVVAGGTVDRIEPAGPAGSPGAGTEYRGAYVLPGLIDMHVHHPPPFAARDRQVFHLLYLAHGVTAVRDTGDFGGNVVGLGEQISSGEFPGARVFTCGPLLDGDPPVWPGSRVVRDADDAAVAVEEVAKSGAHCVKVYSNLSPAALHGIERAAEQRGLPVIGHVPAFVSFDDAGIADVQHLTGVGAPGAPLWEWPNPSFTDFVSPWAAAWKHTDPARLDAIVRTSLEKGIRHTPTLVVWSRIARLADYPELLEDPVGRLVPRYYREVIWSPAGYDVRSTRALGEVLPKMIDAVRRLHEAGVPIQAGTDVMNPFVVPGASLHEELGNLLAAGFSPEQALASATIVPGGFLAPSMSAGIQAGAPADLAIFRRDPTIDLGNLATLEAVVADGRLYPKAALDATLARSKAEFDGPLADRIGMFIARLMTRSLRNE